MARMMPAYCPNAAPPGEKAIYAQLAEGDNTDGWIVLHSLGIADHVRQVEGEADFVVIVPHLGVLVIEAKSHKSIEILDDGRWKLGNDPPTTRSPFKQAGEAMYSIRAYLDRKEVDLRSIPIVFAVWFTHVRARAMLPASPEWHQWQVIDSEDLKRGAPDAIRRTLTAGSSHLDQKISISRGGVGPDAAAATRIASQLRPKFELNVVAGDVRRARQSDLLAYIEEQYRGLDAMAENRSVLFTGPAGSGKTLLAMEAARREVAEGRQGRLLCFNRLLGRRLVADLQGLPGLTVNTFDRELLDLTGIQPPPHAGPEFWQRELPDRAIEVLLEGSETFVRDFLIVDEIQDIARDSFLDVLDLLVSGGLDNGRLLLFGDFERQAIFETTEGRELLRRRCPGLVFNGLTTNCRNLPRIGYLVNTFSGLDPGYRHFRRLDDGVDPTFVTYEAGEDQSALLVESVRQLRDEGYRLEEIAVLSPLRSGSTAAATTDEWLQQVLYPADGTSPRRGRLQFATIQGFKGLEASAVVVTDLDRTQVPNFESLLYVGMTRATDRLVAVIETATLRGAFEGTT